jgi:hypothetical protein
MPEGIGLVTIGSRPQADAFEKPGDSGWKSLEILDLHNPTDF